MQTDQSETIDKALENLTSASHKLAEAMYQAAGSGAAPGGQPEESPGEGGDKESAEKKEEVVDAEFVDVDDKPKS